MEPIRALQTAVFDSLDQGAPIPLLVVPLTVSQVQDPANVPDIVTRAVEQAGGDFKGEAEDTLMLYSGSEEVRRIALVGLGDDLAQPLEAVRRASARGAELVARHELDRSGLLVPDLGESPETVAQAIVEGFWLAAYRYRRYKTDDGYEGPSEVGVYSTSGKDDDGVRRGAERGRILASATYTARDLVNRSPDEKSAERFAELVQESGRLHGYEVDTWDRVRIESENMGGLLAVNRGSEDPPSFSILSWRPEDAANDQPLIIVGKGVMFDTGGLSLKETKGSMDIMKADMAGAAAVVGIFEALANLKVPLHVMGLIPATDNRPGGRAYVPGDVLRMHSGTTVEVLNTDAEGRLILADALSYAKSLNPELAIDLATLTGAAVVALGHEAAACMTSESEGAREQLDALQAAGRETGEFIHPLPMYEEYRSQLDSKVADIKNVGGRAAGSITAGKFLEHFVDYPWIHLDIAGVAFLQEGKPYRPTGGTGFGVRLVTRFLEERARQA